MPSGDCASVNPYSVASRRHTMGTRVTRKIRNVLPVAASTAGDTRITTSSATSSAMSRLAPEASTDPARRPVGTVARTRSPGSGVAGSSP